MTIYAVNSVGTTRSKGQTAGAGNDGDFSVALNNAMSGLTPALERIFAAAAKKYGIPERLLIAVARVESNFHPNATSRCGAMGIMQLMPRTAKYLGVEDAYNPEQNIMGGAKYLSQLLHQFDGDVRVALAAYNAGPGTVRKYGGVPPFGEGYVNKVMKYYGGEGQVGDAPAGGTAAAADVPAKMYNPIPAAADDGNTGDLSSLLLNMYQMWLLANIENKQNVTEPYPRQL